MNAPGLTHAVAIVKQPAPGGGDTYGTPMSGSEAVGVTTEA